MSQILIDCDLLQHIVEKYFQLEAENRAYFSLAFRGAVDKPGLHLQYVEAHATEAIREKEQTEGQRSILRGNLDAQDAVAVHQTLSALFPRKRDR